MIFSVAKLRRNLRELTWRQKKVIIQYVILLNLLMLVLIGCIAKRIDTMRHYQNDYIQSRTHPISPTKSELQQVSDQIAVDTRVSVFGLHDINLKDKVLTGYYYIVISYKKSDFPTKAPMLDLANGHINTLRLIDKEEKNGIVTDQFWLDANIEPRYMVELYPLDQELISVRLTPSENDANYYFKVIGFDDATDGAQSNYVLIGKGFSNTVEHSTVSGTLANPSNTAYYVFNRSYLLFDHKNLYSYIKSIQYIILSLLIAIFALLINSRTNSPKNGRISVIGGSVFSLAANAFQINSTNRVVNNITLIDLITTFSGLIIFLAFLITIRTLIFLDEDGYPTSRVFDQAMFVTLLGYTVFFFSFIYLYV